MAITVNSPILRNMADNTALAKKSSAGNKSATSNAQNVLTESLTKAGVIKIGEKQSAETTAKNILNHVKMGLESLRGQGASAERLEQRLDAARKGIEKGYSEAIDMLKGMGMYDDALKQDIAAGRAMVDQGLAELSASLKKPQGNPLMVATSSALNVSNSMQLTVKTREGDEVTVTFQQGASKQSSQSNGAFNVQSSTEQGWSMSVKGNLSDEEHQALTGLFNDVQSLSERFFSGDMAQALEQAMSLGYDGTQLASFSLKLTQTASASVTGPYAQIQQQLPTEALQQQRGALASYVDGYLQALDKASPLENAAQAFRDMMQQLLPSEARMPIWQSFNDGLNSLLGAK